jgi:sugar lactone lactonase YvrE
MGRSRLLCMVGLLVSASACGSDGGKDETDDVPGPGPGDIDGGRPDGGPIVGDIDATLRPDSTIATPDAATDGGDVILGMDGAIVGGSSCADGFPRGVLNTVRREVRATMPTIEGVAACPNGDVFVSAASLSQVWRIPFAGGEPEVWYAQSTGLFAGLTCDDRGRLFAADYGFTDPGGVVQITGKGAGTPLARPSDFATQGYNGVLVIEGVGVFGSDTAAGRIVVWREDANGALVAQTAVSGVGGANGLARGTDGRLYVALTAALGDNEVVSFAVGNDGKLEDRKSAWKGPNIIDGIAIDENNQLYVAFYNEGKIVRASDGATIATAKNPASLVFRGGTLLFSVFDVFGSQAEKLSGQISTTGHLYAVELAVCGAP